MAPASRNIAAAQVGGRGRKEESRSVGSGPKGALSARSRGNQGNTKVHAPVCWPKVTGRVENGKGRVEENCNGIFLI
jgi:hypothetical protein